MSELTTAITAAATDAILNDTLGKKWYSSKTFWVNIVSAASLVAQLKYGFLVDPATQALALTLINIALRNLTNEPILF